MLETCIGSWFSINWMKIASRWFHYTEKMFTCYLSDSTHSFSKETLYSQIMCEQIFQTRRNFKHTIFSLEN
jgi:hypothetical protein